MTPVARSRLGPTRRGIPAQNDAARSPHTPRTARRETSAIHELEPFEIRDRIADAVDAELQ